VHLPSHPVWFWLILAAPWVLPLLLWVAASTLKGSFKPMRPWLLAAYVVFWTLYTVVFLMDGHKVARMALFAAAYSCCGMAIVIQRHYMFETLRAPGAKWYFPWKSSPFSVQAGTRILVKNIAAVSPWYTEKLGLRKLAESPIKEPEAAIFVFKRDGKPIVLTTRSDFRTGKTPILFTKKIGKMRDVMMARGVEVGNIERDRQGIQYFEIRDPEGNEIEVVEER
jgi:catechol 2,3-dioxygenase-like lactoylglutathione lyase family enzyme